MLNLNQLKALNRIPAGRQHGGFKTLISKAFLARNSSLVGRFIIPPNINEINSLDGGSGK